MDLLLPTDAPIVPLGNPVLQTAYVDANLLHHDVLTGRLVTGILHLLNKTPIDWYSKKQSMTIETATYGSEFMAARTATEQIMVSNQTALRYLRIPIHGPSFLFLVDQWSTAQASRNPENSVKEGTPPYHITEDVNKLWQLA
jgi:hypothetical protein